MFTKKNLQLIISAILFLGAFWYFNKPKTEVKSNANVPSYVIEVLTYVQKNHKAPEGFEGGRTFQNRERRLPLMDNQGKIKYQEWDVHPKINGQNRGAERLVTGNNQKAYYTKDHYQSFIEIP